MKINCVQCKKCSDIIFSRARHDMHTCSCGAMAIDGGWDYMKVSGLDFNCITINVNVSKNTLYDDWNGNVGNWGIHKPDDRRIRVYKNNGRQK